MKFKYVCIYTCGENKKKNVFPALNLMNLTYLVKLQHFNQNNQNSEYNGSVSNN